MGTIQFEYTIDNDSIITSETITTRIEELPGFAKALDVKGTEDLYRFSYLKLRIATNETVVKQINDFMDKLPDSAQIKNRYVTYNDTKYELHGSIYTSLYKDSVEVYNLSKQEK